MRKFCAQRIISFIFILITTIVYAYAEVTEGKFTPGRQTSLGLWGCEAEDGKTYEGELYPENFSTSYQKMSCTCLKVAPSGNGYYEIILRTSTPAGDYKFQGMSENDVSIYVKKGDIIIMQCISMVQKIGGGSTYIKIRITDVKPNECKFVVIGKHYY